MSPSPADDPSSPRDRVPPADDRSDADTKPPRKAGRKPIGRLVLLVVLLVTAAAWVLASRWPASTVSPPPTPVAAPAGDPGDPFAERASSMEEVLQFARDALVRIEQSVDDYTARLIKQEEVGGRLIEEAEMEIKLQTAKLDDQGQLVRPLRVYMRFLRPASAAGREVIWDQGADDGKLVAHEAGLLGIFRARLEPTGMLAMRDSRYPITEIGITNLVRKLIERGEQDLASGRATVTISEGYRVGDAVCRLIRVRHTQPNGAADDFSLAEIAFDAQRMVPLRYAAFGWPTKAGQEPPLLESYTYLDLRLNVGLSDADFDPDNPEYDFP